MSDDTTKNLTLDDNLDSLKGKTADEKLDSLISSFSGFKKQLTTFDVRLTSLTSSFDARLTSLETLVDNRLHDTRPLWEGVQKQLTDIRTELADIRTELADIRTEVAEVRTHQQHHDEQFAEVQQKLRTMEKMIQTVHFDNLKLLTEVGFLEDRTTALEKAA